METLKPANCISLVFNPCNILCSLAALRTLFPAGNYGVTMAVCDWPGLSDELATDRFRQMASLMRGCPNIDSIIEIKNNDIVAANAASTFSKQNELIKDIVGRRDIDFIHYPHDSIGSVYQNLAAAFPDALRVSYGDGLGTILNREDFRSYNMNPATPLKNTIALAWQAARRRLNRIWLTAILLPVFARRYAGPPMEDVYFGTQHWSLGLPVFIQRRLPRPDELTCTPKEELVQVLAMLRKNSGVESYERELLARYPDHRKILFATENNVEAGILSLDRETEMYCKDLEPALVDYPVIFVKPHPGQSFARGDALRARLAGRAEIVDFDEKYGRLPIELFTDLIHSSTIVVPSYIRITMKYLHDVDALLSTDRDAIEHFFLPQHKRLMTIGMDITEIIASRLPTWDRKTILGSPRGRANSIKSISEILPWCRRRRERLGFKPH